MQCETYFDWQTLPEVPSRLAATPHVHSISLRWVGGDDTPPELLVERRIDLSGIWSTVAKLPGSNTSYDDMRLPQGKKYLLSGARYKFVW